jgi:hypothetical protein
MLVVNLGTANAPPAARRAQLKHGCLGFCDNEGGQIAGQEVRGKYMADIVLVSGHCDVLDPESGHSLNGLGRRLALEARNEASPAQIAYLDEATLHVLQTITDPEPWRLGTQPIRRTLEYSYVA